MILVEACVDTATSAHNAELGGAGRVELCDNLSEGGTTPSHGTLERALEQVTIPVFPIIRPRGGGFVYDENEFAVMRADVRHARDLGAPGVVVGGLTIYGDVDKRLVGMLRTEARDMQLTFHRAFDLCRDASAAIEVLIRLGVNRVLTSGQQPTAWEGRETLAKLVREAGHKITIMAGGGVNEKNAAELVRATGVTEIHVRGTKLQQDPGPQSHIQFRKPLPPDEAARYVTDATRIAAIREAVTR